MKTITLNNGVSIPELGFGTWCIDDAKAAEAVRTAIRVGYRHIDTAQAYGNERGVGESIRTCGVTREELFVVSKVAAATPTISASCCCVSPHAILFFLTFSPMFIFALFSPFY